MKWEFFVKTLPTGNSRTGRLEDKQTSPRDSALRWQRYADSVVELVHGQTFTDVVPFFEKYRILVTTRLSFERCGFDQNGW